MRWCCISVEFAILPPSAWYEPRSVAVWASCCTTQGKFLRPTRRSEGCRSTRCGGTLEIALAAARSRPAEDANQQFVPKRCAKVLVAARDRKESLEGLDPELYTKWSQTERAASLSPLY